MKVSRFIAVQSIAVCIFAGAASAATAADRAPGMANGHPFLSAIGHVLGLIFLIGLGAAVIAAMVKSPFER